MQKAFDTVDHQILLAKSNHSGIHGVSNDWFKYYLSIRNQYVSINGYESSLTAIDCSVHQQAKFQALLAVGVFMFKIEFWVKNAHP